jgi:hypothetical protein
VGYKRKLFRSTELFKNAEAIPWHNMEGHICLYCSLSRAPLAVLEGFGEVVGFGDVGSIEVGDGAG